MQSCEVKERPILFSGPMVRAILEGRKTQTRRIVKPQPDHCHRDIIGKPKPWPEEDWNRLLPQIGDKQITCPYGRVGDRLWMRETWAPFGPYAAIHQATNSGHPVSRWKPSIHMPRWASRLTLEITDIRVQRLQDISEEDAEAEGITGDEALVGQVARPFASAFMDLWDSINGDRAPWQSNPWVWAVTFRKIS